MADVYNDRRAFFANYGEMMLNIVASGAGTVASPYSVSTVKVAALKGISITPKFEHVTLYGMERVTRAAVAKHSLTVDVSIEVAMWDPDNDYILQGVLLGRQSTDAITEDNINDINHKNEVARFQIGMKMTDTDGEKDVYMIAQNVYFDSVPYELKENEFITRSLQGTAEYVELFDHKPTAADMSSSSGFTSIYDEAE